MTSIREYVSGPSFAGALKGAREGEGLIIATGSPSDIGDDDDPSTPAIRACLRSFAETFGCRVVDASVFLSAARVTAIVKVGTPMEGAEIAIYHDDSTGAVECQILHSSQISVSCGSHTLWLIVSGAEPDRILDLAYGAHEGAAMRQAVRGLGLRVKPIDSDDMQFETHAFDLEPDE